MLRSVLINKLNGKISWSRPRQQWKTRAEKFILNYENYKLGRSDGILIEVSVVCKTKKQKVSLKHCYGFSRGCFIVWR